MIWTFLITSNPNWSYFSTFVPNYGILPADEVTKLQFLSCSFRSAPTTFSVSLAVSLSCSPLSSPKASIHLIFPFSVQSCFTISFLSYRFVIKLPWMPIQLPFLSTMICSHYLSKFSAPMVSATDWSSSSAAWTSSCRVCFKHGEPAEKLGSSSSKTLMQHQQGRKVSQSIFISLSQPFEL